MASPSGSNRSRVSARSASDRVVLILRRCSRPLNVTRLPPRLPSKFIDLTTPEPEGAPDEPNMPIPEEDVLKQKDPNITDTDEWPSFSLRKVSIVSTRNGQHVSLLEAHKDNSVQVSGQLETVTKDQLRLSRYSTPLHGNHIADFVFSVKDQKYKLKTVELNNITNYAFAEYDDGTFGFWAAGKAGWFEIKNASGLYQQNLAEMNEAASMFYAMVDKTRRGRKDPSKMSIKDLDKYAAGLAKDVGCLDPEFVC